MKGWRERRGLIGLLSAVGISTLGTRMSFLAIPWFVLASTGSATRTGLVAFAEMATYVVLQALCGPVVDRLGAWRMSIVTDIGATICIGLVPALAAVHSLALPLLVTLVAAGGALRGAGDAARHVLVPGVGALARAAIERSSGLFDGVRRLASLIGAPAAGALILATSALSVLAVDAATFAISAALVLSVVPRAAEPPRRMSEDLPYLSSLRMGFSYLKADRLLTAIAVMVMITNFVDQASAGVLVPVWAQHVAHGPLALGLVGGALSLGAVGGNLLTTWLGPRLPRRLTYALGYLLAGAPRFLALALCTTMAPVLAASFIGGFGAGGINPILGAVEYERVPRDLQARVFGAMGAATWLGIPFGSLAAGFAVSAWGLHLTLLVAASVYGMTTLAPFVSPTWRAMERSHSAPGSAATATSTS